jgi:hypothetical protein
MEYHVSLDFAFGASFSSVAMVVMAALRTAAAVAACGAAARAQRRTGAGAEERARDDEPRLAVLESSRRPAKIEAWLQP